MTLVDTSVWIDYLDGTVNPQSEWLHLHLGEPIGYTDLTLCELLQGCRDHRSAEKLEHEMNRFLLVSSGGGPLAVSSARNYRILRFHGFTVRKTIDCMIATLCLERDLALLHHDRDFNAFEAVLGLRVVHP